MNAERVVLSPIMTGFPLFGWQAVASSFSYSSFILAEENSR